MKYFTNFSDGCQLWSTCVHLRLCMGFMLLIKCEINIEDLQKWYVNFHAYDEQQDILRVLIRFCYNAVTELNIRLRFPPSNYHFTSSNFFNGGHLFSIRVKLSKLLYMTYYIFSSWHLPRAYVTLADVGYPVWDSCFLAPKNLTFQYSDYDHPWWMYVSVKIRRIVSAWKHQFVK